MTAELQMTFDAADPIAPSRFGTRRWATSSNLRPVPTWLPERTRPRRGSLLVSLGATMVRRWRPAPQPSAGFIVMTDPEGNEFCL